MPSPLPGMDPWLEHPAIFPDLHDSLIFCLREALNAALPPPYFAAIGSCEWTELIESETMRQSFAGVYAQPGGERLVTTIEVLSLTNKTRGIHGRGQYLQKQEEALRIAVNLIEIDLLRGGEHSTAVPREEALAQTGGFEYHVCVHLFHRPLDFFVFPIRLTGRLPAITVPLLPGEEVRVELQPLLDRCYDTGVYSRRARYHEEPVPSLTPEQAAWARALLGSAASERGRP